jgi:hypothetical protein
MEIEQHITHRPVKEKTLAFIGAGYIGKTHVNGRLCRPIFPVL